MKKFRITELLISIVGAELVGALSALIAGGNFKSYYQALAKPPFSPPAGVFPVVWVCLYALMGYSVYLIYLSDSKHRTRSLGVYAVQLFLNFLWSPVFFGMKSLFGAVIIIVLLTCAVALMISYFYKVRRKAALMQLPYLAWCVYAAYLTVGTYILNR